MTSLCFGYELLAGMVSDSLSSKEPLIEKKGSTSSFTRTHLALDCLTFVVAMVQHMGALTAIYCHNEDLGGLGISLAKTGIVMAVQYVFAVLASPICGTWLDKTTYKKTYIGIAFLFTAFTYYILSHVNSVASVIAVLVVQSSASGMYLPGLNALSLGYVGVEGFPKRATRNEMYRHLGVLVQGIIPIWVVHSYGFHAYFFTLMGVTLFGLLTLLLVDGSQIDNQCAMGADANDNLDPTQRVKRSSFLDLLKSRQIILVVLAVLFFHIGNAAMLPMIGQKIDDLEHNMTANATSNLPIDGTTGVSVASIITEAIAVPLTFLCGRLANMPSIGRRWVGIVGFIALPIRGCLFAIVNNVYGLLTIQALDGIGAAVCGVIPIMMMQDLSQGTGRFSALQGSIVGALGLGTAISQVLAGVLADTAGGYALMYFVLSAIACLAIVCFVLMKETKNFAEG
eukprot:m.24751 g.24751  ORF g.24751 m.24751 type:complete len:454 (-) comp7641_c0_seq2:121-1482(-)